MPHSKWFCVQVNHNVTRTCYVISMSGTSCWLVHFWPVFPGLLPLMKSASENVSGPEN